MVATLAKAAVIHFLRCILRMVFSSSVEETNEEEDELEELLLRRERPEEDLARVRERGGTEPSES